MPTLRQVQVILYRTAFDYPVINKNSLLLLQGNCKAGFAIVTDSYFRSYEIRIARKSQGDYRTSAATLNEIGPDLERSKGLVTQGEATDKYGLGLS